MYTKSCKNCNALFKTNKKNQIYCSKECYRALNGRIYFKTCLVCGKEFYGRNVTSNFCSTKCLGVSRQRRKTVSCLWCNKSFDVVNSSEGKFCSNPHKSSFYKYKINKFEKIKSEPNSIEWSREISYLLGLITSDGNLRKNSNHIKISSNDYDLLVDIRNIICDKITGTKLKIYKNLCRRNGNVYTNYTYEFSSKKFYQFCLFIGLIPNKSLLLKDLWIPSEYFSDFLRGEIDGDGNFNISKRPHIHYISIRIFSGSKTYLDWLNSMCFLELGILGNVRQKLPTVYYLSWSTEFERNKIFNYIYSNCDVYMIRKWNKVQASKKYIKDTYAFIKNNDIPLKSNLINST